VNSRFWRCLALIPVGVLIAPALLVLVLRFVDPTISALMLIRRAQGYEIDAQWRAYDELAPVLRQAAIASEDPNFCFHRLGFDFGAIRRQLHIWQAGGRPSGASTIAMQTARNLFLWPDRGVVRKLVEIWLTPQIALLWPRRRQLEIYLNIVEFGPGVYGAEAASQHWFRTSASELSREQAARLIAVLPSPLRLSPLALSPEAKARADIALAFIAAKDDTRLPCVE
jgi:monofunctional glycosyltransferase